MSFAEYLNLLDLTGRQIRADKRGAIPADLAPIVERLHVDSDGWLKLMGRFGRLFRRAAGRPQSMQIEREVRQPADAGNPSQPNHLLVTIR